MILGLSLFGLLPSPAAIAEEIVKDGSFESTPPSEDNPNWEEFSLTYGTPICSPDTCDQGVDGGGLQTVGPRTGQNWVWFGGSFNPEQASVSQAVTIPPGAATLTFYLWIGNGSGNGLDALRVFMDDKELFEALESADGYGSYSQVKIDVSAYAGVGGPHNLSFDFEAFGGQVTNMSVDDVSLQSGQAGGAGAVTLRGPKKVTAGKKAKLKVSVDPCAGHAGETIDLFRGKKKVASAMASGTCTATFKVRIKRTSKFRAVSPAGTSNTLKVRVRR